MPNPGELLFDANAVIAAFANDAAFRAAFVGRVAHVPVVVGELYFGAYKSARVAENVSRVDRFVAASKLVTCDVRAAHEYGQVKQQLKAKGRMIPENDVWIAAVAVRHDLTLVTRDKHFAQVDGLTTAAW